MRGNPSALVIGVLLRAVAFAGGTGDVLHLQSTQKESPADTRASAEQQEASSEAQAVAQARAAIQRKAIDQVVDDHAAARAWQLFDDRVVRSDYLSNVEVVGKKRWGAHGTELTLKADVDTSRIRADLAKLEADRARLTRLKVMVCVSGTVAAESGKPVGIGSARTTMEAMLRSDGWQVVEAQPLASTRPEHIAATMKLQPADFIVFGTEAFRAAPPEKGSAVMPEVDPVTGTQKVFSLDASYDLSIIDTVTRASIANAKGTQLDHGQVDFKKLMVSYDDSAEDYGRRVAMQAAAALRDAALAVPEHVVELTLTVENLKPGDAEAFIKWSKALPQLKAIARRGAAFIVTPKGTLMELATTLDGQRFKGHAISVGKVTATEIGATLSK